MLILSHPVGADKEGQNLMDACSPPSLVAIVCSSSSLALLRVKPRPGPGLEPGLEFVALPSSEGVLRVCAIFALRAARVVESLPLEREREASS